MLDRLVGCSVRGDCFVLYRGGEEEEYAFEDQAYKKDFHYFLNDMWVMVSFIFNVLCVKSVLLV